MCNMIYMKYKKQKKIYIIKRMLQHFTKLIYFQILLIALIIKKKSVTSKCKFILNISTQIEKLKGENMCRLTCITHRLLGTKAHSREVTWPDHNHTSQNGEMNLFIQFREKPGLSDDSSSGFSDTDDTVLWFWHSLRVQAWICRRFLWMHRGVFTSEERANGEDSPPGLCSLSHEGRASQIESACSFLFGLNGKHSLVLCHCYSAQNQLSAEPPTGRQCTWSGCTFSCKADRSAYYDIIMWLRISPSLYLHCKDWGNNVQCRKIHIKGHTGEPQFSKIKSDQSNHRNAMTNFWNMNSVCMFEAVDSFASSVCSCPKSHSLRVSASHPTARIKFTKFAGAAANDGNFSTHNVHDMEPSHLLLFVVVSL